MADIPGGDSASAVIDLPAYALPAPQIQSNIPGVITVSYSGVVGMASASGNDRIELDFVFANGGPAQTVILNLQLPTVAWKGLMSISFSGVVHFYTDNNGVVSGTDSTDPYIYFNLIEPDGVSVASPELQL